MEKICSIGEGRAFSLEMRALVVVALGACGCNRLPVTAAAAAVASPAEPSLPIVVVPKETMEFHVTFRGITVGTVQTAIGEPGWVDGKHAVIIKSRGKTDGVLSLLGDLRWELESTVDLDRGVPIRDHEEAWAELAGEKHHDDDTHTWSDGETGHDLHSAIGALRGWHAARAEHREIRMRLGGGHFGLEVWPAGKSLVAGRPAARYDGVAAGEHRFSLWVSDDAARVPLAGEAATELGTVAVELVDYGALRE